MNQETKKYIDDQLEEGLEAVYQELKEEMRSGFQSVGASVDGLRQDFSGLRQDFSGLQHTFRGVKDDLDMIKGAHARNEATRKPTRIASGLGYQFIHELSEDALREFGERAAANGKEDIQSFVNTDLVMMVQDKKYQPHYVAVEASFTVQPDDIRRAARTAAYLQELTNIPSVPAVAGVELLPGIEDQLEAAGVAWYQIPKRDIQPT